MNDYASHRDFERDREPEEEAPPLNEQKKNALLRYMAILFGLAFLLVLLSFLIQMRDSRETISDLSQSNASALQNAGKLQDDNISLLRENGELREQIASLEAELSKAKEDGERAETAKRDALAEAEEAKRNYVSQTRLDGLLMDAAGYWLNGDREECERSLSRVDTEALGERGMELYDRLRATLDADTTESVDIPETEEGGEAVPTRKEE